MMSAIRVTWMISPVSAPARAANAIRRSEIRIAALERAGLGRRADPRAMYLAERTLTRLIIEPIERSIPPEMITTPAPSRRTRSGSASIASDWTSNVAPVRRNRAASRRRARRGGRRRRPSTRAGGRGGASRGPRAGRGSAAAVLRLRPPPRVSPCIACRSGRLVRGRTGQLGGDAAAVERQIARSQTSGNSASSLVKRRMAAPSSASRRRSVVDLALRPDVDPARRVEAEQRLEAVREPARDRHLLLVAAREPAHLALGPRVDRERRRSRSRSGGARRGC